MNEPLPPRSDGLPNDPVRNGINPLDTLSYDVNTLMPYNEFNWDTVDGIDDVHRSIMKSYGAITNDIAKDTAKIEANIAQHDANIASSLDRSIDNLSSGVNASDAGITTSIVEKLSPLVENYGNGIGPLGWYVVYRCLSTGQYGPLLESATQAPVNKEAYGPFEHCWPLMQIIKSNRDLLPLLDHDRHAPDLGLNTLLRMSYDAEIEKLKHDNPTGWQGYLTGPQGVCEAFFGEGINCDGSEPPQPPVEPPVVEPPKPPQNCQWKIICPPLLQCRSTGWEDPIGWFYTTYDEPNRKVQTTAILVSVLDPSEPCVEPPQPPPKPPVEPPPPQPPVEPPLPCEKLVICPPTQIVNNFPAMTKEQMQTQVQSQTQTQAQTQSNAQSVTVNPVAQLSVDLAKVVDAINGLCACFNKPQVSLGGGDLEYLYSDAGQARIDSFLDNDGLLGYDEQLPRTIGEAVLIQLEQATKET